MSHTTSSKHPFTAFALTLALAAVFVLGGAAATGAATSEPPPREPPPAAERSASGLASLRLEEGFGKESPDANDFVEIHFEGWTPAGAKFDSSYDRKPAMVALDKASAGWLEGLQLMVTGEKRRFWIPAHLASASSGKGPRGAVIFDIELMAVHRIPSPPADLVKPPPDAERTRYGAFTKVIQESGKAATEETAPPVGALINYTLWTADGKVFDSSIPRTRPTLFPLDKVMAAFADCLRLMTKGEKRLFWIPGNVANGEWMNSPQGPLTFEVELIQFVGTDVLTQAAPQDG